MIRCVAAVAVVAVDVVAVVVVAAVAAADVAADGRETYWLGWKVDLWDRGTGLN